MNETSSTSWQRSGQRPNISGGRPGRSEDDLQNWERLTDRVAEIAQANGWTKAEVARRIAMPEGSFSQWFSGSYDGRLDTQNAKVERWFASLEETESLRASMPAAPGFIRTKAAVEIAKALAFAQNAPTMVIITLEAGNGKTVTCHQYMESRPNVFMMTMTPHTKTVHGMLLELAEALGVVQHNPARLTRAIGRRLERTGAGTLLIVDEAQNLKDEAVDQLRHFVDIYRCGVALVGNTEIYSRFSRKDAKAPSFGQIKSRIGKRVKLTKPFMEDLHAFIDAWEIEDPEIRKFLIGVGMKDGALRSINETLFLAHMMHSEAGQPLSLRAVRAAWSGRDVEGLS